MYRRIAESILELTQGDITRQQVDAIVNAANSRLAGGGGVDGAIHRVAGPEVLQETRQRHPRGCPAGSAVVTGAGQLSARFLFHAVGPVWQGGRQKEPDLLKSAYRSCLQLAVDHNCQSIAFPALSTGAYGYPADRAALDALSAILEFLRQLESPLHVKIVLFGSGIYGAFCRALEELMPD